MPTAIPRGRTVIAVPNPDPTLAYTDYDQALSALLGRWHVWDGDAWLAKLRRERGVGHHWDLPEERRLLAAAVEHFPGSDYSLHLIPAGAALPRPQPDTWLIYAPGRASESTIYPTEEAARAALYACVAFDVLNGIPFDGTGDWERVAEQWRLSCLVHLDDGGRVVAFGAVTSYYPGNHVVAGLAGARPFAVSLDDQGEEAARQLLAARLGLADA